MKKSIIVTAALAIWAAGCSSGPTGPGGPGAKEPGKAWRGWMVDGQAPAKAAGSCDTAALDRNLELGRKYRVQGTPALVFEDGSRAPGAIPLQQIESRLLAAGKKS